MVINHLWFIDDYQRPADGSIYEPCVQQILSLYYEKHELSTLTYQKYKPVINSQRYYFSIAHCKSLLAIAFSPYAIGIDLEAMDPHKNHEKIAKKYFSEIEQTQIGFYYSWTAKEALIKLLGGRLFSFLPHISLQKDNDKYIASMSNIKYSVYFTKKEEFLVAICQNENNILPLKIFELKR